MAIFESLGSSSDEREEESSGDEEISPPQAKKTRGDAREYKETHRFSATEDYLTWKKSKELCDDWTP